MPFCSLVAQPGGTATAAPTAVPTMAPTWTPGTIAIDVTKWDGTYGQGVYTSCSRCSSTSCSGCDWTKCPGRNGAKSGAFYNVKIPTSASYTVKVQWGSSNYW